jgi:hypothetical protein
VLRICTNVQLLHLQSIEAPNIQGQQPCRSQCNKQQVLSRAGSKRHDCSCQCSLRLQGLSEQLRACKVLNTVSYLFWKQTRVAGNYASLPLFPMHKRFEPTCPGSCFCTAHDRARLYGSSHSWQELLMRLHAGWSPFCPGDVSQSAHQRCAWFCTWGRRKVRPRFMDPSWSRSKMTTAPSAVPAMTTCM